MLEDDLNAFGCDPRLVEVLLDAASQRKAERSELSAVDQYVAVVPDQDRHIAVFAHRGKIAIALPPGEASSVALRTGGGLDTRTPATTYVVIPAVRMDDPVRREAAAQAVVRALAWRAQGPVRTGDSGDGAGLDKDFGHCPVHGYRLNAFGDCPQSEM